MLPLLMEELDAAAARARRVGADIVVASLGLARGIDVWLRHEVHDRHGRGRVMEEDGQLLSLLRQRGTILALLPRHGASGGGDGLLLEHVVGVEVVEVVEVEGVVEQGAEVEVVEAVGHGVEVEVVEIL